LFYAPERGLSRDVKDGYLAGYGSCGERVAVQRFVEDIPLDPSHPSWDTLVEIETSLERFADHPTLIVWGERDWCFTPAFRCEWQRRFPRAELLEIETAGHFVIEDATQAVTDRPSSSTVRPQAPDSDPPGARQGPRRLLSFAAACPDARSHGTGAGGATCESLGFPLRPSHTLRPPARAPQGSTTRRSRCPRCDPAYVSRCE
jgi:hypothetical protein